MIVVWGSIQRLKVNVWDIFEPFKIWERADGWQITPRSSRSMSMVCLRCLEEREPTKTSPRWSWSYCDFSSRLLRIIINKKCLIKEMPKMPKLPKMPKINDAGRFNLFFADWCEYGQQFAAFFILRSHLLSIFPTNFNNYLKPILGFTCFTFTSCYFVFKIRLASGSVGLPVICPNWCSAFCDLISHDSRLRRIGQCRW